MTGYFTNLYRRSSEGSSRILNLQPEHIVRDASDPVTGIWQIWAIAAALRDEAEWGRALDWLNEAFRFAGTHLRHTHSILRAELFAAVSLIRHAEGEVAEALDFLDQSHTQLRGVSNWAFRAAIDSWSQQADSFALQIQAMMQALDPDGAMLAELKRLRAEAPFDRIDGPNAQFLIEKWIRERLVSVRAEIAAALAENLASVGEIRKARCVCKRTITWLRKNFDASPIGSTYLDLNENPHGLHDLTIRVEDAKRAALAVWHVFMARGNVEFDAGDFKRAADCFGLAFTVLGEHVPLAEDHFHVAMHRPEIRRLLSALFSTAGALVELKQYKNARRLYEFLMPQFATMEEQQPILECRLGILVARWRANPAARIERELRELLIDYEDYLSNSPDLQYRFIHKDVIEQGYVLLMTLLMRRRGEVVRRAEEYLRIIKALREPHTLSGLEDPRSAPSNRDLESMSNSLLLVLEAYLRPLSGTALLFMQVGDGVVTFLALLGGTGSLAKRVVLAAAPKELLKAFAGMLKAQRDGLEAILSLRRPIQHPASKDFLRCAESLWQLLPADIRSVLSNSTTILFSPDPSGNYDEFPLELLRTQEGWLGTTRVIARLPSVRTLLELLAPNRIPSWLSNRAAVVSARTLPGFDVLTYAEAEAQQVPRYLSLLGLTPIDSTVPTTDGVKRALDDGYRVLHYIGHGVADRLAEGLPLSPEENLEPRHFGQLAGNRTPFVYLSACEVGRSRYVKGGRQRGIAAQLLEKGAPAVLTCLQAVPDQLAGDMSRAFYRAARSLPVGQALRDARESLDRDGVHPACWSLYVLYGDPEMTISPQAAPALRQTRLLTQSWATWLCRYLAGRRPMDRDECCRTLQQLLSKSGSSQLDDLRRVADWVGDDSKPVSDQWPAREMLCKRVAERDLIGGVALRLLLGREIIETVSTEGETAQRSEEEKVRFWNEVFFGMDCADRIFDHLAWTTFAIHYADEGLFEYHVRSVLDCRKSVLETLRGWAPYAPEFAAMLDVKEKAWASLQQGLIVDASPKPAEY